jgi:hypothetical protein
MASTKAGAGLPATVALMVIGLAIATVTAATPAEDLQRDNVQGDKGRRRLGWPVRRHAELERRPQR